MAGEQERWPSGADDGSDLARLLAAQFESLGDVRPSSARVEEDRDRLRFAFGWPLAPWEAVLVEAGQEDRLQAFRAEFLKAVAPSLAEVVEMETGREARSPRPELGPGGRRAMVGFVLGATTDDRAESMEALRNWGSQVRRNARRQRAEHRKQVEALKHTVKAVHEANRRRRALG